MKVNTLHSNLRTGFKGLGCWYHMGLFNFMSLGDARCGIARSLRFKDVFSTATVMGNPVAYHHARDYFLPSHLFGFHRACFLSLTNNVISIIEYLFVCVSICVPLLFV